MLFIKRHWAFLVLLLILAVFFSSVSSTESDHHHPSTHIDSTGNQVECTSVSSCPFPDTPSDVNPMKQKKLDRIDDILQQIDDVHETYGVRKGGKKLMRTIRHHRDRLSSNLSGK